MVDKTQNHVVCYVLKIERMQANKSMPSCAHAETLKEVRGYDRA